MKLTLISCCSKPNALQFTPHNAHSSRSWRISQ